MSCLKKLKCWHIVIPAIILLEIALACVYLSRKVKTFSIIEDSSSQYILLGVFAGGLLLLVLIVICVFGCHRSGGNSLSRLGSRFSRRRRKTRQNEYGYRIQNMMYPSNYNDSTTIRASKPVKKRRIRAPSLFFSRSKPFAVSSESFQYEHGSQHGENSFRNYQNYSNTGVSTLKRASLGTGTLYGVTNLDFPQMQNTTQRSRPSGRQYLDNLSDSQFKLLYGSHPGSYTDSQASSINPSYSENLCDDNFETRKASRQHVQEAVNASTVGYSRQNSQPPILVSCGTFVQYNAPEATNLQMIYTEDDYSKVYQSNHRNIPDGQAVANVRSYQETSRPQRMIFRPGDYGQPRKIQHCNATGSYSTQVQYVNPSGRLVSYRVIKPKMIGAPVSVMID